MAKSYGYFPTNLKLIRESMGITQTELSLLVGATKTMIQTYETGKAFPKGLVLRKIAAISSINEEALKSKDLQPSELPSYQYLLRALFAWMLNNHLYEDESVFGISLNEISEEEKERRRVEFLKKQSDAEINLKKYFSEEEVKELNSDQGFDFFQIINLIKVKEAKIRSEPNPFNDAKSKDSRAISSSGEMNIIPCYDLTDDMLDMLVRGYIEPEGFVQRFSYKPLVIPNVQKSDIDYALIFDPEIKSHNGFHAKKGDIILLKYIATLYDENDVQKEWALDGSAFYLAIANHRIYMVQPDSTKSNADFVFTTHYNIYRLLQSQIDSLIKVVGIIASY